MTATKPKRNLAEQAGEAFKPPVFKPTTSVLDEFASAARRFVDLQAGSAWRDLKVELAGSSGRLVDIGCGAQVFRSLLPPGVTYLGIDTVEAKARFGYDVPDTHYFEGEEWGVEDGSFDVALCTEVLEHIPDPASFLARIFRCLRPGGRLVLTVPFAARWHFIPYDFWRYTPSSLQMLLTAAGFADVRVQARGNPVTVACYKVMALHLMLLFGARQHPVVMAGKRAVGLLLSPLLFLVACAGNLSLGADWGDDCLGYTVTARRPA